MLNARGDSGAGRQLAVFRLKIVITFPKKVLPSKCWQCDVLQRVFAREKCVLGTGSIYGALKMQEQRGRIFMLLNGIITIGLGLMVYAHWPSGSAWILGLFFGINLLFHGFSQLMLGLSASTSAA